MKTYIVGNWKMNFTVGESSVYLHKLLTKLHAARDLQLVVAPSFLSLQSLSLQIDRKKLKLAAQTAFPQDFGSYTGEVSCAQLHGIVDYVLVGQCERRHLLHETDKHIRGTVAAALRNGITPILCLGETEAERSFGETTDVLRDQLLGGLSEIAVEDLPKVILAYEPVWAISSSIDAHLASPDDVAAVVNFLRTTLSATFGTAVGDDVPILYGGSVTPSNAGAYLTTPGVNGLLVGGASVFANQFVDIVETAKKVIS